MEERGVTRPQMNAGHEDKQGSERSSMEMSHEERVEMRQQHHRQTLWAPLTVAVLGVWLMTCPFTFGYTDTAVMWSDLLSGALLVVLGLVWTYTPRHPTIPWAACFVGIWLQLAPLVFWAETAAAYAMDTIVGAWVIALTVLIPGMPGMIMMMKKGPDVPPGWSYNPSSWAQRAPLVITALLGWLISRHLAAFQLGYISSIWEPFFGAGTVRVLTSEVSKSWPISDAGLGAFAYTFEFLMAYMGGISRWRTMPWMVAFFGILVIPLGLTHIVLVIMQPVVVGYWCTLCLAAALVMLLMIPLTVDEVVAMCQFLNRRVRKEGAPFWRTFWKGDTIAGGGKDERSPELTAAPAKTLPAMIWGVSLPWTLALSAALGVWLMFAPRVFSATGSAADSDRLIGAIVLTISVIAIAEVIRAGRFLNIVLGLWLVIAPWVLSGANTGATVNGAVVGVALIVLSLPRGKIKEQYGSWDPLIV